MHFGEESIVYLANDVKLENTFTTEHEIEACGHIKQC